MGGKQASDSIPGSERAFATASSYIVSTSGGGGGKLFIGIDGGGGGGEWTDFITLVITGTLNERGCGIGSGWDFSSRTRGE